MYRKPTHTDSYLNFETDHPLSTKIGVVGSLYRRAHIVTLDRGDLQSQIYKAIQLGLEKERKTE